MDGAQAMSASSAVARRAFADGRARTTSFVAIAAGGCVLWLATFIALAASRLPIGGSAYLALTVTSPAPVFVGVGALASQVAPNRRLALGLSLAVMAAAFAVRVIADTVS